MVRTIACLLMICLAEVGWTAQTAQDRAVQDLAAQAARAQNRGQHQEAAKLYRELLRLRSDLPELRANLGLMLHLTGEYDAAVKEFREALKADPTLFTANLFAGLDLLKLGQYSEAAAYLKAGYALNRSDTTVNIGLGQLYADLGEYNRANEFYYQASQLDPMRVEAWYGQAVTYLRIQRVAIETISDGPDAKERLKAIAETDFSRMNPERSEFLKAFNSVDAVNVAISSGALARQAIARVIELDPSSARVHVLLGNAYSELHQLPQAKAEYGEALRRDPDAVSAHLGLATMYAREGENDLAAQELYLVLKARPRDPEAAYLQGRLLVDTEKFSEAIPHLENALNGAPSNLPEVHALFGKVYASQGKTNEAIKEYKQALVADRRGMYHYRLYRLYSISGDQEKAREMLQQVKARTGVHRQ